MPFEWEESDDGRSFAEDGYPSVRPDLPNDDREFG